MPTKPLKLAILLSGLSLLSLSACQTKNTGLPSDVIARQEALVDEAKAEACRGQVPVPVPATEAEYSEWPLGARQYVRANICQWASACDRERFHRMDCPQ